MIKVILRLPTKDQYAYIQPEIEVNDIGEAIIAYKDAMSLLGGNESLPIKEFNSALDEYVLTNNLNNGTEIYAKMDKTQQAVFQELKKCFKRIKSKQE